MKRMIAVLLCAALMAGVFCACGGGEAPAEKYTEAEPEMSGAADLYSEAPAAASGMYEMRSATDDADGAPALKADTADSAYSYAATEGMSEAMPMPEPVPPIDGHRYPEPQAGMLTAGEWNDNDNFDFFSEVLERSQWRGLAAAWRISPTSRVAVHVTDASSQAPAKGVTVTLYGESSALASAVTNADGMAYIYYNLDGESAEAPVKLTAGDSEYTLGNENGVIEMTAEAPDSGEKTLDLMLMVDTTGSMADELEYLKTELRDVVRRVSSDNSGMKIRVSVNFYRDEGDDYVVRPFEFTEDVESAVSDLSEQHADGGGDTPEAVDEAFKNAVKEHEWSDASIKLVFFVLDAPPHVDRQGASGTMRRCMSEAAEKGIRIIPVVSSGADTELEFLMRSAAAVSGGTYTFLTDDSGIGGSHLEPTVGEYEVEMLNALMIRLINEYCR